MLIDLALVLPVARVTDAPNRTSKRDLAVAWNDDVFRGPFPLPDGRSVAIVHPGA